MNTIKKNDIIELLKQRKLLMLEVTNNNIINKLIDSGFSVHQFRAFMTRQGPLTDIDRRVMNCLKDSLWLGFGDRLTVAWTSNENKIARIVRKHISEAQQAGLKDLQERFQYRTKGWNAYLEKPNHVWAPTFGIKVPPRKMPSKFENAISPLCDRMVRQLHNMGYHSVTIYDRIANIESGRASYVIHNAVGRNFPRIAREHQKEMARVEQEMSY